MDQIHQDLKRTLTAAALRTTPTGDKPARVDGKWVWTADVPGIVSLFPSGANDEICDSVGVTPGQVKVTATADADLTASVRNISFTVDLEVLEAEADKAVVTVGPEVPL